MPATPKLIFDGPELVRAIAEALDATDWKQSYGECGQPRPQLWVVKDEGVYVLSNSTAFKPGASPVCYAEGFHPGKDADWYDRAWAALGGDDFVETIDIDDEWRICDRIEVVFDGARTRVKMFAMPWEKRSAMH